jgi:DNA-directed DNA polymerase III PolC
MSRAIVHLDADAFFASVEQAADSRLRGRPVAVGGEKRGIIASASYEARKLGVYTPMPTARARKLCPKLIVLPGDYDKYEHFSRWMFSYAYDFTPDVEISSIDEGYFDLTGARQPAATAAATIREAIRQALKISVSEGIAINKLVSQIASKLNKPAAFTEVPPGCERTFLQPLPPHWLPGVGPQTAQRLGSAGLATVGQVAATPVDLLELLLGGQAPQVRAFANGVDERPILPARAPAKSYSEQETFAEDTTDEERLEATLRRMADQLMAKVRADRKCIRTVTVKVRYNDMAEDQAGESLPEPASLETELYSRLRPLLQRAWKRRVSLRLVSLRLSNVYDGWRESELPLDPGARQRDAQARLAAAVDQLRATHGRSVILRGHDFILAPPAVRPAAARARQPFLRPAAGSLPAPRRAVPDTYVPLQVHSYYSFLDSTLSVAEIIRRAQELGLPALAMTDAGNLHGAVEFYQAARQAGLQPILGAELKTGGAPLRLLVQDLIGYQNLCHLLSDAPESGAERAEPGKRPGPWPPFDPALSGHLIALSPDPRWRSVFPGRFYLEIASLEDLRRAPAGVPRVASLPTRYGTAADRWKFDVVQSIRTGTLLRQEHPEKRLDGQAHLRSPGELRERFRDYPELLLQTREIARLCQFDWRPGGIQFPAFATPDGSTSQAFLRRLVLDGVRWRYGRRGLAVMPQIETELAMIREVGYEDYFLVVWDLLQACRGAGIAWITRGSAADSLVCYCLGISDVCPVRFELYFRRFLNRDRMRLQKLPDIDLDFPHDRKDDVVRLIFAKYGAGQAAVVGGFSTFQARSAVADIAKVLGVSEHQARRFTERFPWGGAQGLTERLRQSQECRDLPLEEDPFRSAIQLAEFLDGFPRHAKMHPCGVVLSRQPMRQITPVFTCAKGYPTTHYDMDSIEYLGLVKLDILAQGGLAAMRDVSRMLAPRGITLDLERLNPSGKELADGQSWEPESPAAAAPAAFPPWKNPDVWDLIASGGARAVHHIESPAMIGLCRQCNVRDLDGLIAIVSVIRPGAANEHKKTRFIRRYQRLEPPEYPHPSLEPYLRNTFGLVVYEEHILQMCEVFAGLPGGRADVLRRALAKNKQAVISEIQGEFVAAARRLGRPETAIAEVWELIRGFAGYAFCKAHSTAYGVEAYQSAWLKCYYPAEFMAAVLSNGKGFYHPLVYVLECHRLGLSLRPPWVNEPGPGFAVHPAATAEGKPALRVPATRVKGITERTLERLLRERAAGPFASFADFYRRVAPAADEIEAWLRAGAFDGFGKSRVALFWEAQGLRQAYGGGGEPGQGWLLPPLDPSRLPEVPLREPSRQQRLEWESDLLGFPVTGHPLELYPDIAWDTYCPVSRLGKFLGREVALCGLVIEQRLHHQITGELMKFLTLADWTGMVETELFAPTYRSYGLATVRYPVLEINATVEPYENGRGFSLRVRRAGPPRRKTAPG